MYQDLKSAVIYEVFPRNHGKNHNFQDIYLDLERIKSLGTTILWLMPFYPIGSKNRKGSFGSPYSIMDYRVVDPSLGTLSDLRKLIHKAHELDLKVIIDIVYNHTSCDSLLLQNHPDWFLKDPGGNNTQKCKDWSDIYDLDYSHADLEEYQIKTLEFWLEQGIDGFRCDVAPMVPVSFWEKAASRLGRYKDVIWLAESVHKHFVKHLRDSGYSCHSDPELHAVFQMTYDYDGFEYLESYWRGNGTINDYLNHVFVQETLYPGNALKLRFLENHDVTRIASRCKNQIQLQNWWLFYMFLPGPSLVYAGQEYGLQTLPELFENDPVDWSSGSLELSKLFSRLLHFSKFIKRDCSQFNASSPGNDVVYLNWSGENDQYRIIVNLGEEPAIIPLKGAVNGLDLLSGDQVNLKEGDVEISQPLLIRL